MGHPNLSDELNRQIDSTSGNSSFKLEYLPKSAIFEFRTQNSVYTVVVIEPQRGLIAIVGTNKDLIEPDLYIFRGSTFGGSVLKVGFVVVDMHFQASRVDGALFTSSNVKSFVMLNDQEKAKEIISKVEAQIADASKEVTQQEVEEWTEEFTKQIENDFAGEHLDAIQKILCEFSTFGKCMIATFFYYAKEAGKLDEAIDVMNQHFKDHWVFRPPTVRGEILTVVDAHQWEKAYTDIGIDPPEKAK